MYKHHPLCWNYASLASVPFHTSLLSPINNVVFPLASSRGIPHELGVSQTGVFVATLKYLVTKLCIKIWKIKNKHMLGVVRGRLAFQKTECMTGSAMEVARQQAAAQDNRMLEYECWCRLCVCVCCMMMDLQGCGG